MRLLHEYHTRYVGRENLFDQRNAVSDSVLFYGRAALLSRLRDSARNAEPVALYGARKLGKTSVLNQLEGLMKGTRVGRLDASQLAETGSIVFGIFILSYLNKKKIIDKGK